MKSTIPSAVSCVCFSFCLSLAASRHKAYPLLSCALLYVFLPFACLAHSALAVSAWLMVHAGSSMMIKAVNTAVRNKFRFNQKSLFDA